MTSLKTSIKTITYLSDTGCLEIQGASLGAAMPQRTFLMMLIVVCVTILCFVWMVRDSLCGFRIEQGNTVFVATLAYEVKR